MYYVLQAMYYVSSCGRKIVGGCKSFPPLKSLPRFGSGLVLGWFRSYPPGRGGGGLDFLKIKDYSLLRVNPIKLRVTP